MILAGVIQLSGGNLQRDASQCVAVLPDADHLALACQRYDRDGTAVAAVFAHPGLSVRQVDGILVNVQNLPVVQQGAVLPGFAEIRQFFHVWAFLSYRCAIFYPNYTHIINQVPHFVKKNLEIFTQLW